MSTVSTILSFARAHAQTDSNGLKDAEGIIFTNEALVDFHRQLVNRGIDASQLQEAYRDGSVPSSGNGATYLYPTDMLALKTIEVNYASTNPQDYKLATQLDVANLQGQQSFSWLRANQSTYDPKFDDRGDWFEVFPAFTSSSNLTSAIRLFYYLKPTVYTSTGDTIAYPESQDDGILGWRVCANYLYSLMKIDEGDKFNERYMKRVEQYVATLARGSQQPIQPQGLSLTGFEF